MSLSTASTGANDLLAALPQRERDRVLKHCERVMLTQDEILGEPGERISHVYFPIDSFISLLTELDKHDALGVDLIGSEGMLGTSLLLGADASPLRARVQGAGSALRMKAEDFQRILLETPVLERQLRHCLHVQLAQLAQTATCAAYHVVEVRLACWLLMAHDRAHGDRFYLTHDRLARMLGVRRSGVTTAAGLLHSRKLIGYARGHIVILDRKGLEQATCGCYRSVRDMFKQLAPSAAAHREELEGDHLHRPPPRAPGENERVRAPRARQQPPAWHAGLGASPRRH